MKKVLSLLLSALLIITIIPLSSITASAATYSGTCGDNLTWEFDDSTGTLTISGTGEMYDYERLGSTDYTNAPWDEYRESISSLVISEGITSVGERAFYSHEYKFDTVYLPESLTQFNGDYNFMGHITDLYIPNIDSWYNIDFGISNNPLRSTENFYANNQLITAIEVPNDVTKISAWLFKGYEKLEKVILHNGVTEIDVAAFEYCTSLTDIVISDGLKIIGMSAFYGCSLLTEISIPKSVESVYSNAFDGTGISGNTENWEDGYLYIGDWLIDVKSTVGSNLNVKDGTIGIAADSLDECYTIEEITVPSSTEHIGYNYRYNRVINVVNNYSSITHTP